MKIAVTGAYGFIGQHIVQAALAGGHEVLAIDRAAAPPALHGAPRLRSLTVDLAAAPELAGALAGSDCVVHLAAVLRGKTQRDETLALTEGVLAAMDRAGVRRMVALGSISILDYGSCPPLSCVDEGVPVNARSQELGPYAYTKRDQESALWAWQRRAQDNSLIVLRPGLVYDAQQLSAAHAGFLRRGRGAVALHDGSVPLVHVANVASAALAAAALCAQQGGRALTLQLVDDLLPSQAEYLALLERRGELASGVLRLPWAAYAALMRGLRAPFLALGRPDRVPDSLRAGSVAARQKPFRFSNAAAKRELAWRPSASFQSTFSA